MLDYKVLRDVYKNLIFLNDLHKNLFSTQRNKESRPQRVKKSNQPRLKTLICFFNMLDKMWNQGIYLTPYSHTTPTKLLFL